MIKIKLKEAIDKHKHETGERVTYEQLAKETGLSRATVESIASRSNYNASLKVIDTLCDTLHSTPDQLLEYIPNMGTQEESCED